MFAHKLVQLTFEPTCHSPYGKTLSFHNLKVHSHSQTFDVVPFGGIEGGRKMKNNEAINPAWFRAMVCL
jgi:hypothetical protein